MLTSFCNDVKPDFILIQFVCERFYSEVVHFLQIINDVGNSGWVDGGAFELQQVLFPAKNWPESKRGSSAAAGVIKCFCHIACFITQQRHPFYGKCRYCDLA